MLPFQLDRPAARDREFAVTVSPSGVVAVEAPGFVHGGQSTGFIALRSLATGRARLQLAGGAAITLDLSEPPSTPGWLRPQVLAPSAHAAVWERVSVRVTLFDRARGGALPPVRLERPDGQAFEPVEVVPAGGNSHHHYVFEFDTREFKRDGYVRLTPVARLADGGEVAGDPLPLRIHRKRPQPVAAGECESTLETPRPERQGEKPPKVVQRAGASGDACVANHGPRPSWLFAFDAPQPGYYQLAVRASADGVHTPKPALGLLLGESNRSLTSGALATTRWHQVPVGAPVHLARGRHTITVFYENHHRSRVGDSNMFLDRFEIMRVAPPLDARQLRVAFSRPLDGLRVTGPIQVDGFCSWQGKRRGQAPLVELLVNGKPVASQHAGNFHFRLSPGQLRDGENTLQVVAGFGDGHSVRSAPQTIIRPQVALPEEVARRQWLATIFDPSWSSQAQARIAGASKNSPGTHMALNANGDLVLNLPDDIGGRFALALDAKGVHFEGHPKVEVLVRGGGKSRSLGQREIRGNSRRHGFGVVEIPGAATQLVVRFLNDHFKQGEGDRNLHLRGVLLESLADRPAPQLASARIAYPPADGSIAPVDMLVVEAFAARGVKHAELTVNGRPTGVSAHARDGLGRFVLPLAGQLPERGRHQLGVVIRTSDNREFAIKPVAVEVMPTAAPAGRYARAVHLLDRFGFGAEPEMLADILVEGELDWLSRMIAEDAAAPGIAAARQAAAARLPPDKRGRRVLPRSLLTMLLSDNPVHARFSMWSQNHFSTWLRKARPENKTLEDERFFQLGIAPFRQLLMASATSPAMLRYLDQPRSVAGRLNENYAREIMELHTLGVDGGYSQGDVTSLAKLLTGWTLVWQVDPELAVNSERFRFYHKLNNRNAHSVFSGDFPQRAPRHSFERVRCAIEMLAAHPSTARHISGKLAAHYVAVPPPQPLVDELSRVFLASGGDMGELLMTIARHPAFWQADPVIATPFDYSIRLGRMIDTTNAGALARYLERSGSGHFDRETPDGYPLDGAAYADSNGLLQRWILGRDFQHDYARILTAETKAARAGPSHATASGLLDFSMQRLTGYPLGKRSREALRRVLAAAPDKPYHRMRMLGMAIAQLPETNLR